MAAVLLPYGIWLPLILCASALPTFYIMLRLNRLQYEWSQKTTTDRRWLQYYDLLLTHSGVAAELHFPARQTTAGCEQLKLAKGMRRDCADIERPVRQELWMRGWFRGDATHTG